MSWLVKLGLSLWSWLIHQRLTPRFGWLLPLLFPLKIVATALTPLLALLGLLATWRGVAPYSAQRRDLWLMLAGLVSFITGGRYIWQTSAPHTQFETVFGADWWNRVPPALQSRFQTWRWPALGGSNRPVSHTPNITLATSTATGQPLLADLWQPAGLLPTRLAIVYLHGSGWHFLDKDMGTRPLFRYLAGQGHTILDLAYTLAPSADVNGMVAEVGQAVQWLTDHAAELDIDPARIVLMGGSAGGHLALQAGYTLQTEPAIRGVVANYGLIDMVASHIYLTQLGRGYRWLDRISHWFLPLFHRLRLLPPDHGWTPPRDFVSSALRATPESDPAVYAAASPINHVRPDCPPTLLLQGAHDMGGMVEQNRALVAKLKPAGVPTIYVEFPQTDHAFDLILPHISPSAQAARYDIERFLAVLV